jgi:hypothetical protein
LKFACGFDDKCTGAAAAAAAAGGGGAAAAAAGGKPPFFFLDTRDFLVAFPLNITVVPWFNRVIDGAK